MSILQTRVSSVKQRARGLKDEIERWLLYAESGNKLEKNASQLEAFDIFMSQLLTRIYNASMELDDLTTATHQNVGLILQKSAHVDIGVIKAHSIWDFFRNKLEQRFIPQCEDLLFVADITCYDCYKSTIRHATELGIVHKLSLRDYPLTYLVADYSPWTWIRGAQPIEMNYAVLPVPIVGLPWTHAASPWEFLSLHHEVSHDIDHDLNNISDELRGIVEQVLNSHGVPHQRSSNWQSWTKEIVADFMGILLAGPPYLSFLSNFLTLPSDRVVTLRHRVTHPTPYLRILLNADFVLYILKSQESHDYIKNITSTWYTLYGPPSFELNEYMTDFAAVIEIIISTKLESLQNKQGQLFTLNDLIKFNGEDFDNQLQARTSFSNGTNILTNITNRHLIGAAYMSWEETVAASNNSDRDSLEKLSLKLIQTIKGRAPKGQLPLRTTQSRAHICGLADQYFDQLLPMRESLQ